jgi:hypothetical protein
MAKVLTIPVVPDPSRRKRNRISDKRYVDGQKMLVQAMNYLAKSSPQENREALELLSEHFRNNFRMSDSPDTD